MALPQLKKNPPRGWQAHNVQETDDECSTGSINTSRASLETRMGENCREDLQKLIDEHNQPVPRNRRTREFIEHLSIRSHEKRGQWWGLRAASLIGRNDAKCRNILSKYCEREGFESSKKGDLCSTVFKHIIQLK